jgi:large subunit ribosomal protein L4
MRRLAYRSALSVKAKERQIVVLNELQMPVPKTREMVAILEALAVDSSVLILLPEKNVNVEKSAGNLPNVKALRANYLNIRDLLGYDYLVLPVRALDVIEVMLG